MVISVNRADQARELRENFSEEVLTELRHLVS